MPGLILSGIAWLPHLAVFILLAPALLASHAVARAAAAGQPAPRIGALAVAARTAWRGGSFRIEGVAGMATTAPLLSGTAAVAAMAVVPGFCHGLPTAGLADPIVVAALLLAAEAAPVLAALAVGTSATGSAATDAAAGLLRRFAGLLLVAFTILASGGNLDAGLAEATPAARIALLAAAWVAVAQAAEALRGAPGLLAEMGGPDLVLLRWAAAARAAVLLTLARDLVVPWLWPGALPDASALPGWPLALLAWVATLLLAAGVLGAVAARRFLDREAGAIMAAVAATALVAVLLDQATP